MKIVSSIASVAAALALSALPLQAADVLVNGNFNSGDLTGWWTYIPDTANSSVSVLPGDAFSLNGSPYAYQMAHNATANPQFGQYFGVAANTAYTVGLSFRANNWGGAGVGVKYFDSSAAEIGWEFATLYTGAGTDTGWTPFTATWTTPANAAAISFRLEAWGWSDTFYDDVTLNVVPEPGVGALLGLGGLLLIRRRARR
jgi:hypothetical protein